MHRFNSRHFVVSILLASAALAGCTKPTKGPDETSGAFFSVKSVSSKGATQNFIPGAVWKVPASVTIRFAACLEGTAAHERVSAQKFTVEVPGSLEVYPAKTNSESCFEWEEPFAYNHFAGQSGWVMVERDIVGGGVFSGKRRVKIAVNPWAVGKDARDHGVVALVDNGNQEIPLTNVFDPANASRAFAGELQGASRLLVQNVKILAIPEAESGKWVELTVEANMEPVIQTRKANGEVIYQDLQDGDFDLMMQVMESNVGAEMNRKVLLMGGNMHAIGKVINKKLKAEFRVRQEFRANQGNLELVLQIRPRGLNAYKSLLPFNGVFKFGPGTTVKDESGSLANECAETPEKCDYYKVVADAVNFNREPIAPRESDFEIRENYLKAQQKYAVDKEKWDAVQKYVGDNERYIFSNLKLRFTSILPGETTTQRTVVYTAQTCITDNQTGKPLVDTPMEIHYVKRDDGKVDMEPDVVRKKTDESGCLSWNGQAFHKYYEPEEFFEKEVFIQKGERTETESGVAVKTASFQRHLKFYLNPWDDKFTFGWDSREFTEEFFADIRSRAKIPSRFFLSDYNYHTVRFLYNIDQYMELDVKKWVLMGLVPQVLRYSGIINARKMVEKLRDGIYLMKVAIQKSYLDPRDNAGTLLKNVPGINEAQLEPMNGAELKQKEYITTNTVLVRVVDGVIVYPVELMMRDLRLMRVRSNLLIQLEMVDERLVQAYHVFKKAGIENNDLKKKLEEFQKQMPPGTTIDDVNRTLDGKDVAPDLQAAMKQRRLIAQSENMVAARKGLEADINRIQDLVRKSVQRLKERFEAGGKNLGEILNSKGEPTGNAAEVVTGAPITNNFQLRPEQTQELLTVLKVNDFSTVALPKKEDIDLNLFAEEKSGLEKRSFVGPVIFLSNAYSDSMRATDNLDEANCIPKDKDGKFVKDAMRKAIEELELDYEAVKEIDKTEIKHFNNRQNNAYQYNRYFNSLNHLCYQNVDDLIKKEEALKLENLDKTTAASLKYNFVDTFDLDFISLTDEPLTKIQPECKKNVESCMVCTNERTLPSSALPALINDGLEKGVRQSNTNPDNIGKRFRGIPFRTEKTSWDETEYAKLFFEHSLDSKAALCNLMANKIARTLRRMKLSTVSEETIHEKIVDTCSSDGGLIHDIKLRVEKTGQYAFLGGLNLNLNVGEGFSVGTSTGWSAGMEITDFVGMVGKAGGAVIKPASLKVGTGLSSSEGTSISESTYLVSQIAGFDVELTQYERCAWVGLSSQSVQRLQNTWGDSRVTRAIGLGTANFSDTKVKAAFGRGIFVCEGATKNQNKPVTVPESYFYFTQHFTEGDMLDQADLYNHPWLFSLRGMRDFSTFVEKIRAQQLVNFPEFLYQVTGMSEARPKGWALEHLGDAYRNVTPTFPGFYTMLKPGEPSIDVFALQQAAKRNAKSEFSKVDRDPLREVNHTQVLLKQNLEKIKAPVAR